MSAPFKFLDSYQKDELDVFFGREKDTERLYDALSGVKHLLVYGPSGAGKTSLIECGLRNQFSDADWLAITVRRGGNLVASVFEALNSALRRKFSIGPDNKLPEDPEFDFGDAVESLYAEQYKPVYLLFDQFEELLIQGEEEEKTEFFTRLNRLIRYKTPCRMLLILREEFIGHFADYESLCPSIFQHRFRLEKMRRSDVREVIFNLLSAPRYSGAFRMEDPEGLTEKILERLPDRQKEIELTHVQVFLSELWDRADDKAPHDPVLEPALVQTNDNLETVLVSFLEKQYRELDASFGPSASLETLVAMITERNTKLQVSDIELQEELNQKQVLLHQPLALLLVELERRRIIRRLRAGEQTLYEISHDVLAKVLGENLNEDIKLRRRAQGISDVYINKAGYLSQEDLDLLRIFHVHLPIALQERIKVSEQELRRKAKADLNRNRRGRVLSFVLLVYTLTLGFASWQYNLANEAKVFAQQNMMEANYAKIVANQRLIQALEEKKYRLKIEIQNGERVLNTYFKADAKYLIKETKNQIQELEKQIIQIDDEIKSVK